MFSLRGTLAGLLAPLAGRRRRPPQPASPPEAGRPPAGPLSPWYGKRRRIAEDKMVRPAAYQDKTPGYLVHEERP